MSLLTRREVRNQLLGLVITAVAVLVATNYIVNPATPQPGPVVVASVDSETFDSQDQAPINWDDVNLTGHGPSPEDEVATARSKMLSDFEAR